MSRKGFGAAILSLALGFAGLTAAVPAVASAQAGCAPTTTVAVGGVVIAWGGPTLITSFNDSRNIPADAHVGYDTLNPAAGVRELNRVVEDIRFRCPGTHVKVLGHSMGAVVAHAWAASRPGFPNANLILLADPKRAPGPGRGGLAGIPPAQILGWPIAGADSNFGGMPTLSVCNMKDPICEYVSPVAGWSDGTHQAYDFNVYGYSNDANGVVYR